MNLTDSQLEQLFQLMRECGEIMKSAHSVENQKGSITSKYGTANFVTVFDVKVQNTLIEGIKSIVPGAKFFAEEKDNSSVDSGSGFCFIIDPIDGTTNFIHDMKASAISVGMLYDGEPVFGAILDPYRNELYHARKGEGAFLNGEKIHVSARALGEALTSFGTSPYNRDTLAKQSFALAGSLFEKTADIRRSGSAAIDIAFVACGRSDIFFEMILSPWDYAAGYVIVTEAGGKMTSFDSNMPSFGKPSSMLCTNGALHRQVLDIINNTLEEN